MSVLGGAYADMNVSPVKILDPRVAVNSKREVGIVEGVSQNSWYPTATTGSVSNSNISFSVNVPDGVIVNRNLYVKTQYQIVFAGTVSSGGALISPGVWDAVRFLPLQQSSGSIQLQINGQSISISPYEYASALGHYMDGHERALYASGTGAALDTAFQYQDVQGSSKDPLAKWASGGLYNVPARGSLLYTLTGSSNIAGTVTFEVIEPLIALSPLLYGKVSDAQSGLANVSQLNLVFNINDLSRVWSHNALYPTILPVVSSATVTVLSSTLLLNYYTPSPLNPINMGQMIPYPYYQVSHFASPATSITAGSTATMTSSTISLESIPSRIYIFARRQNADRSITTTDTFCNISALNMQWQNRSGLFGSATSHDLWRMSVKNGLQIPYPGWEYQMGSVLAIDPAGDIGLMADESIASLGRVQFNVSCTVKNISNNSGTSATMNVVLYVVVVNPGVFQIKADQAQLKVGLLTKQDVLETARSSSARWKDYKNTDQVFGGSWFSDAWDTVRDVGKQAVDVAKQVVPYAAPIASYLAPEFAPGIAAARAMTGLGYKRGARGRRRGGAQLGGAMLGGGYEDVEELNHNQLAERLDERLANL